MIFFSSDGNAEQLKYLRQCWIAMTFCIDIYDALVTL